MARPVRKATLALIKEKGGWAPILARIADGETIASIVKDFLVPGHGPISRSFLSMLLHEDPDRHAKVREVRQVGAVALMEQAKEIADTVPPDRDHVAKARLQIDTRARLAAGFDPATWREQTAPQVNVNIGSLHLDALRARAVLDVPVTAKAISDGRNDD